MHAFETYPNLYQLVAAYLDRNAYPEESKPSIVRLIAKFLDESSQDELVDLSEEVNKFCFNYADELDERFAEFFHPDLLLQPVDDFLNFIKAQVWIKLGVFTAEEIPALSRRVQPPSPSTPARDFLCNRLKLRQSRATAPLFSLALYLDRRRHTSSEEFNKDPGIIGMSSIDGKYRADARNCGEGSTEDLYPQLRALMSQLIRQSDENSPDLSRLIAVNQFFASCDDQALNALGQEIDLFEALHHCNMDVALDEEFHWSPAKFTTRQFFDLLTTRIEECRKLHRQGMGR